MSTPDEIQLTEGDEAERLALEAERRAQRAQGTEINEEIARKMREFGAEGIEAGTAEPDVLDGLVERAKQDPPVVFLPSVLEALVSMKEDDTYAFQRLWNELKSETDVPMTELRNRLTECARNAKREAKQREKEREVEERRGEVERRRQAREEAREAKQAAADDVWRKHFYTSDDGRLEMRPGEIITIDRREREETIAHYSARIATEIRRDDGVRVALKYEMEVIASNRVRRFEIPAEEFGAMKWTVLAGADVVTAAGPKARDLVRECIQLASRPIPARHEYGFTGWKTINGRIVYMHTGGAIGGADVVVNLPKDADRLAFFSLPAPLVGDDLKRGVEQCLEVMFALPNFTGPLCAAAWRAVLGNNRNVLFVVGQQKIGKTTAMLWAQNHFASRFATDATPTTWDSTAFGVRAALATIGDAVLLVDDYRPLQEPKHEPAFVQIVRSVSDGTARSKGRIDSTVVQDPAPRALLFASGETRPKIDSVNSRLVLLPLADRLPLEREVVERFDRWAGEGRFAGTMAAYIAWLAEDDNLAKVRKRFGERVTELASELGQITREARSAKALASLWAGVLPFFWWANNIVGAISTSEHEAAVRAMEDVFRTVAREQIEEQQSEDASARFVSYLRSAIRSGQAHVTDGKRQAPEDPAQWGWQIADSTQEDRIVPTPGGGTIEVSARYVPRGRCVGVLRGEYVYIDRKAALGLVHRLCAEAKESFSVDAAGLSEQLLRRGFLAKVEGNPDAPRSRTVRAYVAVTKASGAMVQKAGYLCMHRSVLCDEFAEEITRDDSFFDPPTDPSSE